MSTTPYTPRIEVFTYHNFVCRLGITDVTVFWNALVGDVLVSGHNSTVAAAKSRVKQEICREIERYERERSARGMG